VLRSLGLRVITNVAPTSKTRMDASLAGTPFPGQHDMKDAGNDYGLDHREIPR
jgi:hypothetical protein